MSTRLARSELNAKGITIAINELKCVVEFEKSGQKLEVRYGKQLKVVHEGDILTYLPKVESDDSRETAMMLGTAISLSRSNIQGLNQPFKRELELKGTGFKAALKTVNGKNALVLNLGKSHDDVYEIPVNVKVSVPSPILIILESSNKHAVGQASANIRRFRRVDSYKGKGIHDKALPAKVLKETKKK